MQFNIESNNADLNILSNLTTSNLDDSVKRNLLVKISNDADAKKLYVKVKTVWSFLSFSRKMESSRVDDSYSEIKDELGTSVNPVYFILKYRLRFASAIFILFVLLSLAYFIPDSFSNLGQNTKYVSVFAENGRISKIILPDSSLVWLNSGSTLRYTQDYSKINRKLELVGQAFLKVTKDSAHPMIVDCNGMKVKVVGTEFEVCAYPGDPEIEIKLQCGEVEVSANPEHAVYYRLSPGEMAKYNVTTKDVGISEFDKTTAGSWKDGSLEFKGTPMPEVIRVLERRFNIEIVSLDSGVNEIALTAYFFADDSIDKVMELISKSCGIEYEIIHKDKPTKSKIEISTNNL